MRSYSPRFTDLFSPINQATFDRCQAARDYSAPPEDGSAFDAAFEQDQLDEGQACYKTANLWVKSGRNLHNWDKSFPQFIDLLNGGERAGRVHLLDIVDTWEEDFQMDSEDLARLNGTIRLWISARMLAYGRLKN